MFVLNSMDCVSFSSFFSFFFFCLLGGWVCSNFKVSTTCFKVFVYSRIGGYFSYKLCLYHVVVLAAFAASSSDISVYGTSVTVLGLH